MSSLEIHQCRSCGGNLLIDPAKQIYVCTYCGITYDYEYFKEEDVHEKAYKLALHVFLGISIKLCGSEI